MVLTIRLIPEPFIFGPWEDTNVCTVSCQLLQQRTCKEVSPRASCKDQQVERVGKTGCLGPPCKGRIPLDLYFYFHLARSLQIWTMDRTGVHCNLWQSWSLEKESHMRTKGSHGVLRWRRDGRDPWSLQRARVSCRSGSSCHGGRWISSRPSSSYLSYPCFSQKVFLMAFIETKHFKRRRRALKIIPDFTIRSHKKLK